MKYFMGLSLLLMTVAVYAESTNFPHFSNEYRAQTKNDKAGSITEVFRKKDGKLLISVQSDLIYDDAAITVNVANKPYGQHSLLMHEDFNFDGKKDFGIQDGNKGCYGGPSYQIYLANNNDFLYSPEFTTLGSDYCGMFTIDPDRKQLHTMTKSGCCWHYYEIYNVKGNIPVLVKEIAHQHFSTYLYYQDVTEYIQSGKSSSTTTLIFEQDNVDPALALSMAKGKMLFLIAEDNLLFYFFVNAQGHVELAYPSFEREGGITDSQFTYDVFPTDYGDSESQLFFKRGNTLYTIYVNDKTKAARVDVSFNGKTTVLPAKLLTGGLDTLCRYEPLRNAHIGMLCG